MLCSHFLLLYTPHAVEIMYCDTFHYQPASTSSTIWASVVHLLHPPQSSLPTVHVDPYIFKFIFLLSNFIFIFLWANLKKMYDTIWLWINSTLLRPTKPGFIYPTPVVTMWCVVYDSIWHIILNIVIFRLSMTPIKTPKYTINRRRCCI